MVLSTGGFETVSRCVRALLDASPAPEVLLVDNGSTDGVGDAVAAAFPGVEVCRTGRNLGCAGGRNFGFGVALERGAEFVLSLDDDCFVEGDFLPPLLDALAQPGVGAACPLMLYPGGERVWACGSTVSLWKGRTAGRFYGEWASAVPPEPAEVDFASGGGVLVSARALRAAGLFDEDYFIYFEDPDWGLRLRKAGFRIVAVPASRVVHACGMSGRRSPAFYYYRVRNRLLFMRRNARWFHWCAFLPVFLKEFCWNTVLPLALGRRWDCVRAAFEGAGDFLRGRLGEWRGHTVGD